MERYLFRKKAYKYTITTLAHLSDTKRCDYHKIDKQYMYRHAYYQWLIRYHRFGLRKVGNLPHIKTVDLYDSSKTEHSDAGVSLI